MKVLISCEYSGVVRDAFIARGHEAISCDLLPTDVPGPHYQGDVRDLLNFPFDLMIAHPPCTHLSVSGARHFEAKRLDGRQQTAVSFFMELARAPIPRIAIENPVCIMSSLWRKPDQVVQPYYFGHGESKATCFWLKGLNPLIPSFRTWEDYRLAFGLPTNAKPDPRVHRMGPSEDRWKLRSTTYRGIAEAMADQWGCMAHQAVAA